MTRFLFIVGLLLSLTVATHFARVASAEGWGLDEDFSDVDVRNESARRGGRVIVGGGFHGGK